MKDSTLQNTERFIKSLRRRKNVIISDVYISQDIFWDYYFIISGYLNDSYFNISIIKSKQSQIGEITIEFTTDCEDEILKIMLKYNLKPTNI